MTTSISPPQDLTLMKALDRYATIWFSEPSHLQFYPGVLKCRDIPHHQWEWVQYIRCHMPNNAIILCKIDILITDFADKSRGQCTMFAYQRWQPIAEVNAKNLPEILSLFVRDRKRAGKIPRESTSVIEQTFIYHSRGLLIRALKALLPSYLPLHLAVPVPHPSVPLFTVTLPHCGLVVCENTTMFWELINTTVQWYWSRKLEKRTLSPEEIVRFERIIVEQIVAHLCPDTPTSAAGLLILFPEWWTTHTNMSEPSTPTTLIEITRNILSQILTAYIPTLTPTITES